MNKEIRRIEEFKIIFFVVIIFQAFLILYYPQYDFKHLLRAGGGFVTVLSGIVISIAWIISTYTVTKILRNHQKTSLSPILAPCFIFIGGFIGQLVVTVYLWIKANKLLKEISHELRYTVRLWGFILFTGVLLISPFSNHPIVRVLVTETIPIEIVSHERIYVEAGKEFSIPLESNSSRGFEWQLDLPIESRVIKFIGTKYIPGITKAGDRFKKEIWTFKALDLRGGVTLYFKYVRPSANLLDKCIQPITKKSIQVVLNSIYGQKFYKKLGEEIIMKGPRNDI